jgi:O-glycosyl hydrolase
MAFNGVVCSAAEEAVTALGASDKGSLQEGQLNTHGVLMHTPWSAPAVLFT